MSIAKIRTYLNQPTVADKSMKESILSGASISAGIALLVYLFFLQYTNLSFAHKLKYSLTFGIITLGIGLSIDLFFYYVFPNWMAEKNWTVGKFLFYVLFNFITIAIGNYFYMVSQKFLGFSIDSFVSVIGSTFLVGSIPLCIATLYRHNKQLKKSLGEAQKLNQALSVTHQVKTPSSSTFVKLNSNGNSKAAELNLDNFLFAISEKNYVRFVINGSDDLQIRSTIKTVEEQIKQYPKILRTHRAFIVNSSKITNVEGNAQGYRLSFDGTDELALVSRSYVKAFRRSFEF